jgi:hypothetical protein
VLFVCCLIVVPLPPGENPFAVNNNNNNNNNNNDRLYTVPMKGIPEVANNEFETLETAGFQSAERGLCPPNLSIISLLSLFMKKDTLIATGRYVCEYFSLSAFEVLEGSSQI